jgi:hypothetical protein
MPTDGTLFLENLPHSKQYLLTLLSVFFSLGAVLSSLVSYILLPGASCLRFDGCDIEGKANDGWRRVLFVLGLCVRPSFSGQTLMLKGTPQNLACAFARWFLFRLHESPRYLVSAGREAEAVVVLRAIANFNDHSIDIQRADVLVEGPCDRGNEDEGEDTNTKRTDLSDLDNDFPDAAERSPLPRYGDLGAEDEDSPRSSTTYNSVGIRPAPMRKHPIRTGSAFYNASVAASPAEGTGGNAFEESFGRGLDGQGEEEGLVDGKPVGREERRGRRNLGERRGGIWHRPREWVKSWREQMGKLFVPKWRRTVILMWIIWGSMSFGKPAVSNMNLSANAPML